MKFKTKVASAAVAAALGMMAGSAQAVFMSTSGVGQVLIYPYYTVQNGYDTYISVTNSTDRAKGVKVRFIEGKASKEVLDFNLYLSKYDVWTGVVISLGDGAALRTKDTSCTAPQITTDIPFRNGFYIGTNGDSYENAISRTREGYVEIIEMGVPNDTIQANKNNPVKSLTFEQSVTHDQTTGKPVDCAWVSEEWVRSGSSGVFYSNGTDVTNRGPVNLMDPPTGGLFGSASLINVNQGTDYTYDPTVLDSFSRVQMHSVPGNTLPTLGNAYPESTVIVTGYLNTALGVSALISSTTSGPVVQIPITEGWGPAFTPAGATAYTGAGAQTNAVNAVLIRGNVMNEYALDTEINAGTDWVVTFPTKRLNLSADDIGRAYAPWLKHNRDLTTIPWYTDETFKADGTFDEKNWKACEAITLQSFNREEKTPGAIDFSPSLVDGTKLCKEVNVITFKNSKVLGSKNLELNIDNVYTNGWINMGLWNGTAAPDHALPTYTGATDPLVRRNGYAYIGLPVTGFAVQKYVNGNIGGVLSNYGGSFIHKYKTVMGTTTSVDNVNNKFTVSYP
jgi:hypothetical protein